MGEEQHYAGAVVQPLFQNSLFVFERCADLERALRSEVEPFAYTRISNPTTALAEKKIAALEGTEACRLFASGMGAISAAVLSTVRAGSHVVCTNAAYGPTKSFLLEYLPKFDVQTTLVDGTDVHAVEAAIQGNTELLYLETPGSVTFAIQDLEAMVKMARRHGIT
ncbi:MAG: cystathionine beta-lyase, partial [Armatimonadota bacterium]